MEKERRIKGLSIVALLIAVVGLTIAFAAMNRTLNINNTTAKVGKFNVRFVSDTTNLEHGKNHEYTFIEENDGTEDKTSQNIDLISDNGATVSNLAVQFNMLGVTAEYKLKIQNFSDMAVALDTEYGTNGIQFESGCSANGISCELKKADTNRSALGNLVLSKSGESGDSIYVMFRITANDDPNASTIQETLKENLGLRIKFIQSSGSQAQEQSSGDDPIIVDDTDTYYNISFKNNLDSAILSPLEGKFAVFATSDNQYNLLMIDDEMIEYDSNVFGEQTTYKYYYTGGSDTVNSWAISGSGVSSAPTVGSVRIAPASEIISLVGQETYEGLGTLLTISELQTIVDGITN